MNETFMWTRSWDDGESLFWRKVLCIPYGFLFNSVHARSQARDARAGELGVGAWIQIMSIIIIVIGPGS